MEQIQTSLRLDGLGDALKSHPVARFVFFAPGATVSKSHPEVAADSARLASWLRARGLVDGARIGLLAQNSYESVVVDFAAVLAGLPLAALHVNFFINVTDALLDKYGIDLLIGDVELLSKVSPRRRLSIDDVRRILSEPAAGAEDTPPARIDPIMSINFTSGTTGTPKAVAVRRDAAEDFIRFVCATAQLTPEDCNVSFFPSSVFSQRLLAYAGALVGFDVVLTNPEHVRAAFRSFRPTILQAVPHFYESLAKALSGESDVARRRVMLDHLLGGRTRFLLTGSAPIGQEVLEFFAACGHRLYEGYGANETGLIAFNTPAQYRPGSVGKPVPGKEVQLDDEGQILVRGRHCWAAQYLEDEPELNRRVFQSDGFIATGDLGEWDDDGFLYIRGRLKDVVNLSNGLKANPGALEAQLCSSDAISQAAVFGHEKPSLTALVVRAAAATDADVASAVARVNEELPRYLQISAYSVIDEAFSLENGLLSNRGKLNRAAVLQRYGEQLSALYNT